jgi:ferritin-like metal-binding protein YciE
LAKQLGVKDAVSLHQAKLAEEAATDKELTHLAQTEANA